MENGWKREVLVGLTVGVILVLVGVGAGWLLHASYERPQQDARDTALAEIAWSRTLVHDCAGKASEQELAPLRALLDQALDDYRAGNTDGATAKARQARGSLPPPCPQEPPSIDLPGLD